MISPNSFFGFVFTRAIDMDLDPPNSAKSLNNTDEKQFDLSTRIRKVLGARMFCLNM
jgi:hypothetical protein